MIALPEDFARLEKVHHCDKDHLDILKEFTYPSKVLLNSTVALFHCEQYCGKLENCWGCSPYKNISWNAISNCVMKQTSKDITELSVVEKKGTLPLTFDQCIFK